MLRPMLSVTECLPNKPNVAILLSINQSINQVFVYLRKTPSDTDAGGVYNRDYEHNYIKVAQLRPPVTKMVIGSINWAQGNRIMSSFYHFAYLKLHTDDKKCLVYRGGGKEGQ